MLKVLSPLPRARKPPLIVGTVAALLLVTVTGAEEVSVRMLFVGMVTVGVPEPPLLLNVMLLSVLFSPRPPARVRVELPTRMTSLEASICPTLLSMVTAALLMVRPPAGRTTPVPTKFSVP